jgi:uncharacterized membrane protein
MNSGEINSRDRAASNAAVVATAGAIFSSLPVAVRQIGLIKYLPDPPGGIFDSDRITTSRMAHPFGVPDALLGLGSYGITLELLLIARHTAYAKPLLRAKLNADAAAAVTNVVRQLITFRRICSWCTATAFCTAVLVYYGRRSARAQ